MSLILWLIDGVFSLWLIDTVQLPRIAFGWQKTSQNFKFRYYQDVIDDIKLSNHMLGLSSNCLYSQIQTRTTWRRPRFSGSFFFCLSFSHSQVAIKLQLQNEDWEKNNSVLMKTLAFWTKQSSCHLRRIPTPGALILNHL